MQMVAYWTRSDEHMTTTSSSSSKVCCDLLVEYVRSDADSAIHPSPERKLG
jgi:hypothetical protein